LWNGVFDAKELEEVEKPLIIYVVECQKLESKEFIKDLESLQ